MNTELNMTNKCCLAKTNFPYNIYSATTVEAGPYFKSDINNMYLSANEFLVNPSEPLSNINPRLRAKYGWIPFSNGYGQGIHIGSYNCYSCQDTDPAGFSPFENSRHLYLKQC